MGEEDPLVIEYRKSLPDKLRKIKDLSDAVKKEKSSQSLDALRRDVHKLAGSAGTYGFTKASDLCKALDLELQEKIKDNNPSMVEAEFFARLDAFCSQLSDALVSPDKIIRF